MKRILVYKDVGVSGKSYQAVIRSLEKLPWNHLEIAPVKSAELQVIGTLKDVSLLVVPGGCDLPYVESLSGNGKKNIRQWVEEGGAYFGICAGAYFGSSYVSFEEGTALEVKGKRALKFFEGTAVGPAYGTNLFRYHTEYGARAAKVKVCVTNTKSVEFNCYYNGGCTFKDSSKFNVIALYEDISGKPPAIIECKVGQGLAILSGVHPEFTPEFLDLHNPYLQAIIPKLKETEPQREQMFEALIRKLLKMSAAEHLALPN